jgi:hypothetical protein
VGEQASGTREGRRSDGPEEGEMEARERGNEWRSKLEKEGGARERWKE